MGEQTLPFGEKKYPLELVKCNQCHLVQLNNTVPQDEMYNDDYGYRSGINETIKADLKDIVDSALTLKPDAESVLDTGSNDGTLLSYYPDSVKSVRGFEPVKKLADESFGKLLPGRPNGTVIVPKYFSADITTHDIVTAISMFYDLDDPNQFVKDLKQTLNPGGLIIVQQNYLLRMLENNAYDNICHEHLEYYSLLSLENLLNKHGLEVFRVEENSINGGSLRTYICHKNERDIQQNVYNLRDEERKANLHTPQPYKDFAKRIEYCSKELKGLIENLNNVYAYGASTRGSVIVQKTGIKCDAVVERNPDKFGKDYHGMPVITEAEAAENPPDYALILPWFHESITKRVADQTPSADVILPLPVVQVIKQSELHAERYA